MIQVVLAPEPLHFDDKVRQKGLSAIDEMVGRPPRRPHGGPVRDIIAGKEEDIPPSKFPPYWRDASDTMLSAYGRRCAFLALYLEHGTGNPSVDHMIPKSTRWDLAYEWSNYRLCAASLNAQKSDMSGLIDPLDCRQGWFALELVGFQITLGVSAPVSLDTELNATIDLLNGSVFCKAREEYCTSYQRGDISIDYLERRAPFVAYEMRRQGTLRVGD